MCHQILLQRQRTITVSGPLLEDEAAQPHEGSGAKTPRRLTDQPPANDRVLHTCGVDIG
jgi:hypothetical protein